MSYRPKIGLTMRLEIETERFYLGRYYSEALEYFGATPILIPLIPKNGFTENLLQELDGILLPGSDSDIDPIFYDEDPHPKLKKVVPEKDSTDLLILEEAEKLNLPILAICFGMQAVNVYFGGSLIQDIDTQVENAIKHEQGLPLNRQSHIIKLKDQGRLANLCKKAGLTSQVKVNSHHHQAVNKVGKGLIPTAWTNDGIVECLESVDTGKYIFCVQWHPEIGFENDLLSQAIFKDFVSECDKFAQSRGKFSE